MSRQIEWIDLNIMAHELSAPQEGITTHPVEFHGLRITHEEELTKHTVANESMVHVPSGLPGIFFTIKLSNALIEMGYEVQELKDIFTTAVFAYWRQALNEFSQLGRTDNLINETHLQGILYSVENQRQSVLATLHPVSVRIPNLCLQVCQNGIDYGTALSGTLSRESNQDAPWVMSSYVFFGTLHK